jgi:hypothetical protein
MLDLATQQLLCVCYTVLSLVCYNIERNSSVVPYIYSNTLNVHTPSHSKLIVRVVLFGTLMLACVFAAERAHHDIADTHTSSTT